ncbi:MAG: PKD domain-containing protein, partial [Cyclobacteriaceae bacterium]
LTYSWDFNNDGMEDSIDPDPTYQFQNTGTFDVSLVVQATNGCTNNATQEITIYPEPPTPDFEVTNESVCSNSELSFSNLSSGSGYPEEILSYTWDFDGVGASSDTNSSFTFSSGGTKQVSLAMAIPGCETFISKNIEVIPGPDVDFEFIDSCETSEVSFANETTGDAISSYSWDFGDGFEDINENPSHIFQTAGNYDITLQSTNETGCVNQLSKPITIYSLPNVSFSTDLGCENSDLQFTDESSADNANISGWSWDFAGLGTASDQNPTFNFQEAGTYEIELVAETNYGCIERVIQEITVLPSPEVDFKMNINCLDEISDFEDITSTLSNNPISSWYWEIDDQIYTEQNPNHLFSTNGMHNVSLTVTTENGCAIQKNQEFNLESLPVADFTVANTCDNQYTIFDDISTVESSAIVSRTWSIDGIASLNGQMAIYNFSQAGTYEVTLTVLNEIGCTSSITKTVEIFKAPNADFETDVDFGAPPLQVHFENNSIDASSFEWSFDDNANSGSSEINPDFTFNEVKDYNIRLVANNDFGCTDTTYAKVVSTIPELDLELLSVTPSLNNGVINLSVSMINSGTVRIDGLNVVVSLENDFKIIEKYEGTLNANQEETYTLNFDIPASNSNIGYVCVRLDDNITDIADRNASNNEKCINIDEVVVIENPFPNPCEDELALKVILPSSSSINLHLLNIHGKTVYSQSYPDLPSGLNSFLLDLQNFEKGMYFLKIQTSQVEEVKRILKF